MMLEANGRTSDLSESRDQRWISPLPVLVVLLLLTGSSISAQVPLKKNVLILNEVGLSHSLTNVMTQQIVVGIPQTPSRHVEFFAENLDLLSFPGRPSLPEIKDWLAKKYGNGGVDVVVAIGPDTIKFLSDYPDSLFQGVPIVICGSAPDQAGNPKLAPRFTGTWQKREPGKTVDAALALFPNTRHVFVVGGSSVYDQVVMAATKEFFTSFQTKADFSYLDNMDVDKLLEQLRNLPENSIVFYTSFFQDSTGKRFVNATQALPMIASAANAPVFGMSDTYLGHGIIGGAVMDFTEQGRSTAQIVSKLLDGKKAESIHIEALPSMFMFDWNELRRWNISERVLPFGSVVLFREPSFWQRTKWIWISAFLIILSLSALAGYLQYSRKQLNLAREMHKQLSGMLINAEEQERRRIASELHDDFSQRLAVLALGLENVDEATPSSSTDLHKQLAELLHSTRELGADLHTLSHRLHSSTLESLGLVPAIGALCKEFTVQQGIKVDFTSDTFPRTLHPDTALCVFRIVQEGLRNLKKHSGATEAAVDLRWRGDRLEVTVQDEGCGFNVSERRQDSGIGIRSMEERIGSLGGGFKIHSSPGNGTTIQAWVPLSLSLNSMSD